MATLTLDIPDELLTRAGLTVEDARLELACWLFDSGRLSKAEAAHLCRLTRLDFDKALADRRLPVMRYTVEAADEDLRHARDVGAHENGESH